MSKSDFDYNSVEWMLFWPLSLPMSDLPLLSFFNVPSVRFLSSYHRPSGLAFMVRSNGIKYNCNLFSYTNLLWSMLFPYIVLYSNKCDVCVCVCLRDCAMRVVGGMFRVVRDKIAVAGASTENQ